MMVLAVTLHNIPEGMAVGVMYAGFLAGSAQITAARQMRRSVAAATRSLPRVKTAVIQNAPFAEAIIPDNDRSVQHLRKIHSRRLHPGRFYSMIATEKIRTDPHRKEQLQ